jgi:hypothetical protein
MVAGVSRVILATLIVKCLLDTQVEIESAACCVHVELREEVGAGETHEVPGGQVAFQAAGWTHRSSETRSLQSEPWGTPAVRSWAGEEDPEEQLRPGSWWKLRSHLETMGNQEPHGF